MIKVITAIPSGLAVELKIDNLNDDLLLCLQVYVS